MDRRFDDQMRVTFPASSGFAAVGRVAAAGLAFRLGFDVAQVESLRLAVEEATTALNGSGSITLTGYWNDSCLRLELVNPASKLNKTQIRSLEKATSSLDTGTTVSTDGITIQIGDLLEDC